jgi:hypothetical protein
MAKKDFKPHMMYCKDGKEYEAKTYQDHLKYKKQGCGHKKPKGKDSPMKMDNPTPPSPVKDGKKVPRRKGGVDPRKEK